LKNRAIRASITENATQETQASAFSIFAFFGNIGLFVGTLLGGGLAKPAEQYPSTFGKIQFFHDFPYALPTLTVGLFIVLALIVSVAFIDEVSSLRCFPPKLFAKSLLQTLNQGSSITRDSGSLSTWEILSSPGVPIVLFIWSLSNLLGFAFTAGMTNHLAAVSKLN
jgi:hypothetical protein